MKKYDSITKSYKELEVNEKGFYTENGEKIFRIETKGKSGKKLYTNGFYLNNKLQENPVFGMGGSTGHGWGGYIVGYLTEKECIEFGIK